MIYDLGLKTITSTISRVGVLADLTWQASRLPYGGLDPMEKLTDVVKAFTLKQGADVIGIGSAEAMNRGAKEGQRPEQNLPGAKAVVSCPKDLAPRPF